MNYIFSRLKVAILALVTLTCLTRASAVDLVMWYQQPVGGLVNEPLTSSPGQPPAVSYTHLTLPTNREV